MAAPNSKRNAVVEFQKRLFNSRFFTVSVLLHFVFVLAFGSAVLFKEVVDRDFPQSERITGEPEVDVQALQDVSVAIPNNLEVMPTSVPVSAPIDLITAPGSNEINFIDSMDPPQSIVGTKEIFAPPLSPCLAPSQLSPAQLRQIAAFTGDWSGKSGVELRERKFDFTAFLAKYGDPRDKTRGGDWASTNRIIDGKIATGSLPNLLYYMNKMSKNRITANPDAIPLDLSSDRIFVEKPPFIFFTGHRDFVLTDKEVENLQKYIQLGGCIWGDSSLPGLRSRFDTAFRREMRRVIPDADKEWEALPFNHPLYANRKLMYYPEVKSPPPGVNFYAEPAYALKFGGEIAILYTANDYGDLWQFGLNEKNEFDMARNEKGQYLAINHTLWQWRNNYIRNVSQNSVVDSYKFGTNVVIHLLTRWEEKIRAVTAGL